MSRSYARSEELTATGYAPLDLVRAAAGRWWIVATLALLGALAGWGVSLLRPPLYEAKASITTGINYSSTGELTQFEEDAIMDAVGAMFRTAAVLDRVQQRLADAGIQVTLQTLKETVFLERRLGTWELRARDRSPEVAMQVANTWMEEGYTAILEAYRHALATQGLAQTLRALEACLAQAGVSETSSDACRADNLPEIQSEMNRVTGALYAEQLASQGILSGTLFSSPEWAGLPERPVAGRAGGQILAGCLAGFLVGFVFAQAGMPHFGKGR